ncbi:unnamed protein product [Mycena citricolor]|uniref:Protein kinase domain-containing protein n=1 Tax=Mycena citricolor TaxID=2018698 RepID=A0AAD2GZ32_9AGAR|nr:unnamed protein product [Mycena citricolor]
MAYRPRPLPTPPTVKARASPYDDDYRYDSFHPDGYPYMGSQFAPYSYRQQPPPIPTTLRGGTLLHKGFYDLLSIIPTPSAAASRFLWGAATGEQEPVVAGPRYEEIKPGLPPTTASQPVSPPSRKARRISKDMVSRPTGFVHLVHASDADQFEALLTRWGPDGMGKLGDPRWANPIKNRVRQTNQARAVNEVVNAMKPSVDNAYDGNILGPLRVVNGGPSTTTTSSTLTTAARENFLTPSLPSPEILGRPGNSTIRWAGGLQAHREADETAAHESEEAHFVPPPPKPITPSLATLEKAVSARIYFENLYFPLFRQPSSREQRRLAMERDMAEMKLSHAQKENLRMRWFQNESDYLRDKRRRVDVTAFKKLKTIGHGAFGVVSLVKEQSSGKLYAMKEVRPSDRREAYTDQSQAAQNGHASERTRGSCAS